ncbi:MAG: hypothetical protein ACFFAS_07845 [Promethearchaeota archaeon]
MMSKRLFFYIFIIFITLITIPEYGTAKTTKIIAASKDSYVDSGNPGENYGSYLQLQCGNLISPTSRYFFVFIYFPISSVDPT